MYVIIVVLPVDVQWLGLSPLLLLQRRAMTCESNVGFPMTTSLLFMIRDICVALTCDYVPWVRKWLKRFSVCNRLHYIKQQFPRNFCCVICVARLAVFAGDTRGEEGFWSASGTLSKVNTPLHPRDYITQTRLILKRYLLCHQLHDIKQKNSPE